MAVTVDELLTEPFRFRTRDDKEKIVSDGKPRPFLLSFNSLKNRPKQTSEDSSSDQKNNFRIIFDSSCYDAVEWLTGCDKKQTLFCWPCLLFRMQKSEWNTGGIHEMSWTEKNIKNHEKCLTHVQSMLDLHLFSQTIIVNKPPEVNMDNDNDLIKRNREIIKRVIDVVCFLVTLQHPPRTGTSDKNRLQIEDCLENVQFLREYDILHSNLIDDATDMLQITPKMLTDVIDALTEVVKESIRKEAGESPYVSLILSEHAAEPLKSQLSTVLRYVRNGVVFERFVGFTNSEGHRTYQNTAAHVKKTTADYLIAERIIAYSLNGSVLYSVTSIDELKNELRQRYPLIHFLPCHFHSFDLVLQQCYSANQDTDYFFKNLKALGSVFEIGSKMYEDFQAFRGEMIPILDISVAASHLDFFKSLKAYRKHVVEFFEHIMHQPEKVSSEDLIKVYGLQTFLQDFRTVFLIEVFAKLYDVVSPLTEALSEETAYGAFDTKLVESVLENFQHDLAYYEAFEILWEEAIQERSESDCALFSDVKAKNRKKYAFHKIFSDLVKCTSSQIKCRLEDVAKLKFVAILDMESSSGFPDSRLESLCLECSTFSNSSIDSSQLMKEIKLFHSNKNDIKAESVHHLLKLLKSFGLSRSFGNLVRLCESVLTMPFTSSPRSRIFSKLKEIQNWCYSPGKYDIAGDLSILCVERDYLVGLSRKESFYDDVIRQFSNINKTMLLVNNTDA